MYLPRCMMPNRIWKIPPSIITVKARAIPLLPSPPANSVNTVAITTVIGPVGPEICEGVPPNRAAKKPTIIAPYKPAVAPAPEAIPKARARGRATTDAVTPPNTSPRRFLKCKPLPSCIIATLFCC